MKKIFLLAFTLLLPAITTYAELNKQDVKSIVREFIEGNGELLLESIATYEKQRQQQLAMASVRKHTPILGPDKAPVTIIEFSEFECPFCRRAQPTLQKLRQRYGDRIRFAFKHLPLDFHAKAKPASYAAQAAWRQGKFWEFSAEIWKRQEFLGEKLFVEIAKELKLDMDKFNTDRASDDVKAEIAIDLADASAVGARGTPFFLINGQPLSGAQPIDAFVTVIEAALQKNEKK